MSYVEQFEIEMELNYLIHKEYPLLGMLVSDDAFSLYKRLLWLYGFFINGFVLMNFEIVKGDLIIADDYIRKLIYQATSIKLCFCLIIIYLWFHFKYSAIKRIEKKKFEIKDPGIDPETVGNWLQITFLYSMLYQDTAFNFIMHTIFIIMSFVSSPVWFSLH